MAGVRILVTNDDGVHALGVAVLGRALHDAGHEVLVAAPLTEASGSGAGVGPIHMFTGGIHAEHLELEGLEGIETLGVEALPALIVIASCMGGFGPPPDLVVSGINPGRNVGRSVLHSGTVGAALTAAHFGRRALAMSIQTRGLDTVHYETAAALAVALAPLVVAGPARLVINCNVPNLALAELRGLRRAHLSRAGMIRSALADKGGPGIQLDVGLSDTPSDQESDQGLTGAGFATLTPLVGVSEDEGQAVGDTVGQLLQAWGERDVAER
jgi:5'-nucleotidase